MNRVQVAFNDGLCIFAESMDQVIHSLLPFVIRRVIVKDIARHLRNDDQAGASQHPSLLLITPRPEDEPRRFLRQIVHAYRRRFSAVYPKRSPLCHCRVPCDINGMPLSYRRKEPQPEFLEQPIHSRPPASRGDSRGARWHREETRHPSSQRHGRQIAGRHPSLALLHDNRLAT